MKRTPLITCLGASVAAALVGHLYLQRLEAEVSGGPKLALLVASEDLPLGTRLTESKLAVRDVPEAYVDPRQVRASEAKRLVGVRLSTALKANDSVLWSDVSRGSSSTRLLSGLVERGMRAVSIEARSSDFDGLLRPGDRVDVLFTEGAQGGGGATRTLLQNLLVLSVGSDMATVDEKGRRGGVARAGSVTLGVSVEAAQIITHAEGQGRLSLTLRNSDDIVVAENLPETTTSTLERRPPTAADPRQGKLP
jgi:pilus assembly protein CpaB